MPNHIRLKTVVIGSCGIGKTSLAHVLVYEQFPNHKIPTVTDNCFKYISTNSLSQLNNEWKQKYKNISFYTCDTASADIYDRIRPLIYRDCNIALICFDINQKSTFEQVNIKCIPEINLYTSNDITKILVGLKSDTRELYVSKTITENVDLISHYLYNNNYNDKNKNDSCHPNNRKLWKFHIPLTLIEMIKKYIGPNADMSIVLYAEAVEFATSQNMVYLECSALKQQGVSELLNTAGATYLNNKYFTKNGCVTM